MIITSTPSGASVRRAEDRKLLGTTPYRGSFPRGSDSLLLVVEKPGCRAQSRRVSLEQDSEISITLPPKEPRRVDSDERRKL